MNPLKTSICAAAAVLACAAAPAFAGPLHDGPITREQVRAELREWRAAGALPLNGEAGDTMKTIAARDRLNERQAAEITAAYEAEAAQIAVMQAAEADRLAMEQSSEDPVVALADAEQVMIVYAPDEVPVLVPVDGVTVAPSE